MASTDFKVKNGLIVNGTTTSQAIIPSADITYDLGSAEFRFRDLYLSTNTLYLGNTALSIDENGKLAVLETIDGSENIDLGIMWVYWNTDSTLTIRTTQASSYTAKFDIARKNDTFTLIDGQAGAYTNTTLTVTGPSTKVSALENQYWDYTIPVDTASGSNTAIYNFTFKASDVIDISQLSDDEGLLGSVDLTGYATESFVNTAVDTRVQYFEQANPPTVATNNVKSGDTWKDTDNGTIYIAAVENSVATWFAL